MIRAVNVHILDDVHVSVNINLYWKSVFLHLGDLNFAVWPYILRDGYVCVCVYNS